MPKREDPVERDYRIALHGAMYEGDTDLAYELSIGLRQYRTLYKVEMPRGTPP